MTVLAIIPARGGSKGVPGKNIKLLNGKPLIQYTIEAALEVSSLTRVMVSTDSPKIAELSKGFGAEVPELRPKHLATDTSPTVDTVRYVLDSYENQGVQFDAVCLLQPTTPFRTAEDIEGAISKFLKEGHDSLISVLPVPHEFNPHWVFEETEAGAETLRIATGETHIISRRQDLPPTFYRNGAIYITSSSVIRSNCSLYGSSIGYYIMSPEYHVNIDTLEDWEKAETLISKGHV